MTVYAHINTVATGSTGGIMIKEHRELLAAGEDSYAFWGRGREAENPNEMKFASDAEVKLDVLQTRIDGKTGFHSKNATKRLLARLDVIKPDVVHLHNLHGYYVNVEMLFEWLVKHECKVEWTLHDCWAFTGHCVYFTCANCSQWKEYCANPKPCSQLSTYPKTYSKSSCSWNFEQKKRLFNLLPAERMKIITPSQWLADLVRESFLKGYPIEVRHNTIDTSVFKPTPSDFRERCGISDRFMILGVASPWTERKGLSTFVRLAELLDSKKYAIVLVGLSKKQIKLLSKQLVALPNTKNQEKLAEDYSADGVSVHPDIEVAFGPTVVEPQVRSTPVVDAADSVCAEVADSAMDTVAPADFSTLEVTVIRLIGGGRMILTTKTSSAIQLAAIYTSADVFFNPTVEDNFPTVNLEAEACGTPVVTYDTGGCSETISMPDSALVSAKDIQHEISRLEMRKSCNLKIANP